MSTIEVGTRLPSVIFRTRVRDPLSSDVNPFVWKDVTTEDLFGEKRVVLFSLPGAFTPTCSTYQLPGFESLYEQFRDAGVDEIYCMSVNDSFVMNRWADWANLKNVKVIPDGSGTFTENMGMLVQKDNLGFGARSWRYAVVVNYGVVEKAFIEPGFGDNVDDDPYGETSPDNILNYILNDSLVEPKGRQLELELFDGIDSKAKMS